MKNHFAYGSLLCALISGSALADPNDAIFTTYSENGLHQIDFKIGNSEQKNQPGQNAASIGLGLGLTDDWFSEFYVAYAKDGSGATHLDSASSQNTFLLSGPDSPFELGLYTELEYSNDRTAG